MEWMFFTATSDAKMEQEQGLFARCKLPPGSKEIRDILFPDHPAMPLGCPIKAKFAVRAYVTGNRGIYHMEDCRSYGRTKAPDRWFCSEDEAKAEGFRKAFSC